MSNKIIYGLLGSVFGIAVLLSGTHAALAADEELGAIEEIIVTAQRREQLLQEVPISMSVLNEVKLERMGIDNFSDYITAIPGISFNFAQGNNGGRYGARVIGMRGIQQFGTGTAGAVGFYLDDTPTSIANPRIFDAARIEVLRGPQGTLYGSGSVGGTIRIITNEPDTSAFSSRFNASYYDTHAGDGSFEGNAMVNIPIGEGQFALRLVGMYRNEGGWVDNLSPDGSTVVEKNINSIDSKAVRAKARFEATEDLVLTASIYAQREKNDAAEYWSFDVPGIPDWPKYARTELGESWTNEKFVQYGFVLQYAFSKADLVSTTSYFDLDSHGKADSQALYNRFFAGDRFAGLPVDDDSIGTQKTWVHETRLVSNLGGKFEYVAGVFYQDNKRFRDNTVISQGFNDFLGFPLVPVLPEGENMYTTLQWRNQEQIAVFGEATYYLTPKFDVTAGLRWFKFKSDNLFDFTGLFFPGQVPGGGESDEDGVNPKVTARYTATDDFMLYGTVSKGFRPGNANFPLPGVCDQDLIDAGITPPPPPGYTSDKVWNYETGFKSAWADNRVNVNLTVFQADWTDIQLVVPLPTCQISGYVTNAGNARSKGVEFQVTLQPIDGLQFTLDTAYIDAKMSEDNPLQGMVKGQKLPNIPRWTVTVSGQYSFPIFEQSEGFMRLDVRYRDETPLNLSNTPIYSDDYTQVDARVGIQRGIWEFALFGRNLTNEDPMLSRGNRLGGGAGFERYTLRPRVIGIRVAADFN